MAVIDGLTINGTNYDVRDAVAVRFNEAQNLGDTAKATARSNIDAASEAEISVINDRLADLEYEPLEIKNFNINYPTGGIVEIGAVVTRLDLEYQFNKKPESMEINGESVTPYKSGGVTYNNQDLRSDTTYVLNAKDTASPHHGPKIVNGIVTLYFYNAVYYGTAAAPQSGNPDSAFVNALQNKVLSNSVARTFTVNASNGQYIWYAVPATFAPCHFNVCGFDGGFDVPITVSVTNASGYTENYSVYRSTNPSLGNTTIKVS